MPVDTPQVAESEFEKALAYAERMQEEYDRARFFRLYVMAGILVFLLLLGGIGLGASVLKPNTGLVIEASVSAIAVVSSLFGTLWFIQTSKVVRRRRISLEEFVRMLHEIEYQYLQKASAVEQTLLKIRLARLEL